MGSDENAPSFHTIQQDRLYLCSVTPMVSPSKKSDSHQTRLPALTSCRMIIGHCICECTFNMPIMWNRAAPAVRTLNNLSKEGQIRVCSLGKAILSKGIFDGQLSFIQYSHDLSFTYTRWDYEKYCGLYARVLTGAPRIHHQRLVKAK